MVIQAYAPTSNAEDTEVEWFYEDLKPLRTNTQKRCPFHFRRQECKSRKSRNIWSNRQIWPWSTEWSMAKASRVMPRERAGHSKHPLPTTQEMTTHGHHQMVNTEIRLILFFAAKDGEALYSQQKQDWELTVAQIMNSLLPNSDLNWRTVLYIIQMKMLHLPGSSEWKNWINLPVSLYNPIIGSFNIKQLSLIEKNKLKEVYLRIYTYTNIHWRVLYRSFFIYMVYWKLTPVSHFPYNFINIL